ncbi:TetR/AcrR family transcriptional regulator [Actinoplanes sp. TBRC 11911]|nr:TetR/AcrR family transcriptional regulator [Actinoplanes sp. TBRC 11911]
MVQAGKQLIAERGFEKTAFSDVLKATGAPRGSVYHHFPGGKTQLGIEAAELHAHEQVALLDRIAEQSASGAEMVGRYLDTGRDNMVGSGYSRGCGIAPLVIDGAAAESAEVGDTSRRAFGQMIDRLAFHLAAFGLDRPDARAVADAVIAGAEGAMVTSRALGSPAPWDAMRTALVALADAKTPKPTKRAVRVTRP